MRNDGATDEAAQEHHDMVTQYKAQRYKYGDGSKSTVQIVLDALVSLGGVATRHAITAEVLRVLPNFNPKNVAPDLSTLAVNSFARSNFGGNQIARRSDEGHLHDQIFCFKRDDGETLFTLYDRNQHGIWALAPDAQGKLRPQLVEHPSTSDALYQAQHDVESEHGWALHEDARRREMALIVRRQGQPAFRASLMAAYKGQCAISRCRVAALLEAAHIVSYRGPHTNAVSNGLLLRADLHKLFDLGLVCVDPSSYVVRLHESLLDSEYVQWNGVRLAMPAVEQHRPSGEALAYRAQQRAGA
jgi:hypothetical protein